MATVGRLLLLRHALAGEKLPNRVQDFDRGLDEEGEAVAALLPNTVARHLIPAKIFSSPYRRCVDTVRPLARTLGLLIHEDERFAGSRSGSELRNALLRLPANAVVCTHGEIIERLFDDAITCDKGAFWIVERSGSDELAPALYVDVPSRR